jgi:parallel beta-helix repeat protein
MRKNPIGQAILVAMAIFMMSFIVIGTVSAGCVGDVTGTDYGCGDTVIESCTFNENLTCPEGGLNTGADGITIDGNGYTLSGMGGSGKEGIRNTRCDDVTIKNLNIRDFCFGIYFTGVNNCSIKNNSISYGVGSGIWLHNSLCNELTGNRIYHGDEGHGILLSLSANNNTIGYNSITTSNGMGVCIEESKGNELDYNYICCNARGDIVVTEYRDNRGDNNTCGIADNYNDTTGGMPCTYSCLSCINFADDSLVNESGYCDRTCGCISDANASKIFACGDIVTESCTFNCNLSCKKGHGLIIGAGNITLDGNGYTLDGVLTGACDGWEERSGIYNMGYDNVTIRNLEIKNFCNGIYLEGDIRDVIHRNAIDNCDVHHNGNASSGDTQTHGIKMRYVYNSTISNNKVHHNFGRGDSCESGGNGIFLYAGDYNLITNNSVYRNTKSGIFTKMKPKYNNISYNTVTENGQGGVVLRCKLSSFFIIENNIASDNKGVGIYVGGAGNTIRYNTVIDNKNGSAYGWNGMGIWVEREAHNTTLISNNVTGNDYVDIKVKEGLTGTSGYNNTYKSSSNYEDISIAESEIVEGKRIESEWIKYTEKEKTVLPSANVTPLMATLLVLVMLAFVFYGYLRGKNNR